MKHWRRREFLSDVTRGMIVAGLGPSIASQLESLRRSPKKAPSHSTSASCIRWSISSNRRQRRSCSRILVKKMRSGDADLRQMIAAASLANAETFGGEDYVGYHTEMALVPALRMSKLMPEGRQALPVLKVLYRNADRIQQVGGGAKKTLRPVSGIALASDRALRDGEALRAATREGAMEKAEGFSPA